MPPVDLPPPPPLHSWAPASPFVGRQPAIPDGRYPSARPRPDDEPSDFYPGDLEISVRYAFNGYGYGPLSLAGAFTGWGELQVGAEWGATEGTELTVGVGAELFASRPVPLRYLTRSVVGPTTEEKYRWNLTEAGLLGRLTLHYTGFSSFDPYGVVFIGPTGASLSAKLNLVDETVYAEHATLGLRTGAGIGAQVASEKGWVGGLELRYLFGVWARQPEEIPALNAAGDTVDTFELGRAQRPARGFSWVFSIGYRI